MPTLTKPLRHEIRPKRMECPRYVSGEGRCHCPKVYGMHTETTSTSTTVTLEPAERRTLARLRAEGGGLPAIAARLGVSRWAFERAAGGLGVRRGTAMLVRQALARLAAEPPEETRR
jgi:hypothetical protein